MLFFIAFYDLSPRIAALSSEKIKKSKSFSPKRSNSNKKLSTSLSSYTESDSKFQEIEEYHDVKSLTIEINNWIRSGRIRNAAKMSEKMLKCMRNSERPEVKPNIITYK